MRICRNRKCFKNIINDVTLCRRTPKKERRGGRRRRRGSKN